MSHIPGIDLRVAVWGSQKSTLEFLQGREHAVFSVHDMNGILP